MLLFNEKHERINSELIRNKIINELDKTEIPADTEIAKDLGSYFQVAHAADLKTYGMRSLAFDIPAIGTTLLQKIKKYVCDFLKNTSTTEDITDAVLMALANIIPGGIINEKIAAKFIKYILNKGVTTFCAV